MKKFSFGLFLASLFFAVAAENLFATDYYIDSRYGDDKNDGHSPKTAWQQLEKANQFHFAPGDRVLFARGSEWRGSLKLQSGAEGAVLYYGAYGKGAKPIIMRSVPLSSPACWQPAGKDLWVSWAAPDFGSSDVGNIILNGKKAAFKKWRKEDLTDQDDFWYDLKGDHRVYYRSQKNPGDLYIDVEAAVSQHVVDHSNSSYVVVDGLDIRYGAAHGFGGGNASFLTIRNCDISWIGGGDQYEEGGEGRRTRFGNGIEFWGEAHNCIVEKNKIWEVYDAALTNQGKEGNTEADIVYRDNLIWNCEYSFEYWNGEGSLTKNILFERNYCFNAGFGWGHVQRPDKNGRCIMMYRNSANTENFVIRNNVFCNATESLLRIDPCPENPGWPAAVMTLDQNCWYNENGRVYFKWLKVDYSGAQFNEFRKVSGKEKEGVDQLPEKTLDDLKHWNKVY